MLLVAKVVEMDNEKLLRSNGFAIRCGMMTSGLQIRRSAYDW